MIAELARVTYVIRIKEDFFDDVKDSETAGAATVLSVKVDDYYKV